MNFKRYVEASDTWVDSHYIMGTDTDTITTLPAVLYPNAATATVGLKGQTVQSSTPSPTSPVMPQGTGERTGQIIEYPYSNESGTINGVQWTISENGHIKGVGTTSSGTNFYLNRNCFLKAGTYTLKIYGKHEGMVLRLYDSVNATIIATILQSNTDSFTTFTLDSDTSNECRIYFNIGSAGTNVDIDCDVMFNSGSTVLPYEPYGYKIPISSNSTTTPVYLGEVESTRRIRKLVVTGQEAGWRIHQSLQSWFQLILSDSVVNGFELCTHYKPSPNSPATIQNGEILVNFDGSNNRAIIRDTTYTTLDDFKTYLQQQYAAGTPVTVWYVLATPETATINEPLMKIGDYADEVTGISIPVTVGANTIDVDTTLKPSEVTVNYKGWHPVQSIHERENGQWD